MAWSSTWLGAPLQDISQAPPGHPQSSSCLGLADGKCVQWVCMDDAYPCQHPLSPMQGWACMAQGKVQTGKGSNIALYKITAESALVESCSLYHHLELVFNALEQEG